MGTVLTGGQIEMFRFKMLLTAMKLELTCGMKMTSRAKARSPFAITKQMLNIAGKPRNVDVYNYALSVYNQAMKPE